MLLKQFQIQALGINQATIEILKMLIHVNMLDSFFFSQENQNWAISQILASKEASLVAQTVKNPPAMWETQVRSLGWEDPLEEGMATPSSILAWRIPMDRGAWWTTVNESLSVEDN